MTNEELKAALDQSPSPDRITPDYLKNRIASIRYLGPELTDGTLTICIVTMDNGFKVTGVSACADPANYNKDIGEKIAYDNAERQIWPLLGFMLKEVLSARKVLNDTKAKQNTLQNINPPSLEKTQKALGFFASCIKSGEEWTEHCEKALSEAKDELKSFFGENK